MGTLNSSVRKLDKAETENIVVNYTAYCVYKITNILRKDKPDEESVIAQIEYENWDISNLDGTP
jgi:hypothetical protein